MVSHERLSLKLAVAICFLPISFRWTDNPVDSIGFKDVSAAATIAIRLSSGRFWSYLKIYEPVNNESQSESTVDTGTLLTRPWNRLFTPARDHLGLIGRKGIATSTSTAREIPSQGRITLAVGVAVICAKKHKCQSVTAKWGKSQTPKFITAIQTSPNLTKPNLT